MNTALIVLGVIVVASIVGLFVYLSYKREQARRAEWAAWGHSRGWSYSHHKDKQIAHNFSFLNELRQGSNRYGEDVFQGLWSNRQFLAFSYHYQVTHGSGDNRRTTDYWLSVVAIRMTDDNIHFPELTIGPEGTLQRFGNLFTNNDIDFESVEFSRRFEVKSSQKQFAYEVCHAQMIDYLMQNPALTLEIEGQWIAEIGAGSLKLGTVEPRLQHLSNIVGLLPGYLFSR